jgi:tagatose 1,6-diphosphate aldolase|tara:strand:- start:1985 stop:2938 length:954 start_codon:yes stop_codon:yes gene_type:complete
MLAVDQRPPIFNIISNAKGRRHTYDEVVECKKLITSNLSQLATAILMDPNYSLSNILQYNKSKGLVITLEDHSFIETERGRYSDNIQNWSVEKIKKVGGDAVKVLAWYRPDADSESIEHQKKYVKKIGEECEKYSIPFLLELLVYPFQDDENHTTEYQEQKQKKTQHVIDSVKEFSKDEYKVDIFKLESPVHSNDLEGEISQATEEAFKDLSNATNNKPWVVLSSGMGKDSFYKCLELAYKNGASGYLAGRTIWLDAFNQYPNIELVEEGLKVNSISYVNKLNELTAKNAQSLETYFNNGFKIDSPEQFSNNFGGFV